MATPQERLSEFSEDIPPLGEPAQLLCQDHCGAYARATLRQPWPLKAVDTWKQDTFVADGGWATFSGGELNQNAAEACAESAERGEVGLLVLSSCGCHKAAWRRENTYHIHSLDGYLRGLL